MHLNCSIAGVPFGLSFAMALRALGDMRKCRFILSTHGQWRRAHYVLQPSFNTILQLGLSATYKCLLCGGRFIRLWALSCRLYRHIRGPVCGRRRTKGMCGP